MLRFLRERKQDYDANTFIGELFEASKCLGILEAKIAGYQFDRILVPMLHKKEAISTMYIEGTQTTLSDIFESEITRIQTMTRAAIGHPQIIPHKDTDRIKCMKLQLRAVPNIRRPKESAGKILKRSFCSK